MPFTSAGKQSMSQAACGIGSAYLNPTPYVSLHTASPGLSGSIAAEASGRSYTRKAVTFTYDATDQRCESSSDLTWIDMPAGTYTHVAIHSASSGADNMVWYGAAAQAKTVSDGDELRIAISTLSLEIQ